MINLLDSLKDVIKNELWWNFERFMSAPQSRLDQNATPMRTRIISPKDVTELIISHAIESLHSKDLFAIVVGHFRGLSHNLKRQLLIKLLFKDSL